MKPEVQLLTGAPDVAPLPANGRAPAVTGEHSNGSVAGLQLGVHPSGATDALELLRSRHPVHDLAPAANDDPVVNVGRADDHRTHFYVHHLSTQRHRDAQRAGSDERATRQAL